MKAKNGSQTAAPCKNSVEIVPQSEAISKACCQRQIAQSDWQESLNEAIAEKVRPLVEQMARLDLYYVAQTVARVTYWRCRMAATPSTKEWVWLERQIRNKKLADGTVATFPRLVDGVHRNPDEPRHWYWFLAWGDGSKKRKYVPRHQIYLVRSLIESGRSVETILLHLTPSTNKGGVV